MKAFFASMLLAVPAVAGAALDLNRASVQHLDNGLELIVLEEHTLPVASVQMLYRTGARDEQNGRTGLAHFLEHMAFRATKNFPDTEVASRIYAVGGEWHAYTWIDQTTYFETVPKQELDLVLRIEADRLGRLLIPQDGIEAERGAVLAEMHGYENDPALVLNDAVVYSSLIAHPYRNNTIGWESDVRGLDRHDLVGFYRAHYHPATPCSSSSATWTRAPCASVSRSCSATMPRRSRRRCHAPSNRRSWGRAACLSKARATPATSSSSIARRRRAAPTFPPSCSCKSCSGAATA